MTTEHLFKNGYAEVNGLKMYYEIHGSGKPLVLIHGGGSTIQTTFGRLIPLLAAKRRIIAVELQAHGHTADRNTPLSFQQDADDIAALLPQLNIYNADFLGFSNGGQTGIELGLRHPALIRKLILASTFYTRDAAPEPFWDGFAGVSIDMMPQPLQEGYLKANNSQDGLLNMFNRDVERMKGFTDWTDEQIRSIQAPTLVINATHDVGSVEHAVRMYRTLPNAELAILPGLHGEYLGAIEVLTDGQWSHSYAVGLLENFLDKD